MTLRSDRLMLRPLDASDATQKYAGWLNDPQVNQYLETRHSHQSRESCKEFIDRMNRDPCSHLFGIFLDDGREHIGNAKLGFINQEYATAELSLFIGERSCWGKGFAGEVVRLLTEYGFGELGLHRIEAGCYEENLASLRVFLKAGYSVEGFFRDSVVSNGRRTGVFWLGILKREFA